VSRKLELVYSDVEIGHPELGMMPRDERIFTGKDGYDADDEDEAYQRFLKQKGVQARVVEGTVFLDD
jgi:hypothetical protein